MRALENGGETLEWEGEVDEERESWRRNEAQVIVRQDLQAFSEIIDSLANGTASTRIWSKQGAVLWVGCFCSFLPSVEESKIQWKNLRFSRGNLGGFCGWTRLPRGKEGRKSFAKISNVLP